MEAEIIEIIELLKNQGLMITEQRMWIIEAVCQAGFIANVEAFWLKLRETRSISRAATHHTLRLMSRFGILRREGQEDKLISYRLQAGNQMPDIRCQEPDIGSHERE